MFEWGPIIGEYMSGQILMELVEGCIGLCVNQQTSPMGLSQAMILSLKDGDMILMKVPGFGLLGVYELLQNELRCRRLCTG